MTKKLFYQDHYITEYEAIVVNVIGLEVEEKANQIFSQYIELKTFPDSENEKSTTKIGKVQLKRKNIGSGKERIEIITI